MLNHRSNLRAELSSGAEQYFDDSRQGRQDGFSGPIPLQGEAKDIWVERPIRSILSERAGEKEIDVERRGAVV
jgi:hypothetical protein